MTTFFIGSVTVFSANIGQPYPDTQKRCRPFSISLLAPICPRPL
uniref:Uncharacterized protein n=1 Tax=Myoviridae sp. ctLIM9 TaxID=2827678 RepID=A0A8S5T5G9_9CAUD|nr:MAG TPA: hypothetical protein [Myoviridae sp. ctLIM9]